MRVRQTGMVVSSLAIYWGLLGCSAQSTAGREDVVAAKPEALTDGATVVVGPEIGTDVPTPMPTTLGSYPALASDGSGYLAVFSNGGYLRGTRVSSSGEVLDLNWLDLGVPGYAQYYSDAVFGGGHYLVAWSQSLQDGSGGGSIQGRFVKSDGTIEGATSFQLSSGDGLYPSVAWDGSHFLVAWEGFASDTSSIRYALVNPDGSKVAGSELAVSATGNATNPRITAGTNYSLVVWEEYDPNSTSGGYKIQGVRIDKAGAIKDSPALVLGPPGFGAAGADVDSSGSRFLVTWNTIDSPNAVRGAIVGDDGSHVKNDFAISHSTGDAASPTVDFDGTNFLVAWGDARNDPSVYGISVTPDGTVSGTTDKQLTSGGPRYVSSGASDRVNLAYNGTRHMLNYLGDGVRGTLIDKNLGIVVDDFSVSALPNRQGFPHLVWDGTNFVVAWPNETDPNDWSKTTVRAERISNTGALLDPNGISITPADTYASSLSVASAGKNSSLFAYSNSGDVPGLRALASNGTLGSVSSFGASSASGTPNLVTNGSTYLGTYTIGDSTNGAAYARIIKLDGTVGAEVRLDSSTVNTGTSAVPIKGGYLVAYAKSGTNVVTVSDLGAVGTSSVLSSEYVQISGGFNGEESLVVWNSDVDMKVHGRFSKDGSWSGDAFDVIDSLNSNAYPTALWDGTSYYVGWETSDTNGRNRRVVGRSVSSAGKLGTIQTFTDVDTEGVVLASDGQGAMLVSYIKWIEFSNSRRVFSRLLTSGGVADAGAGGASNTGTGGQTAAGTTSVSSSGGTSAVGTTSYNATGGTTSTTTGSTVTPNATGGNVATGGVSATGSTVQSTQSGGSSSSASSTTPRSGGSPSTSTTMTTSSSTGGASNGSSSTIPKSTGGAAVSSSSSTGTGSGSGKVGCSIDVRSKHSNSMALLIAGAMAAFTLRRRRP